MEKLGEAYITTPASELKVLIPNGYSQYYMLFNIKGHARIWIDTIESQYRYPYLTSLTLTNTNGTVGGESNITNSRLSVSYVQSPRLATCIGVIVWNIVPYQNSYEYTLQGLFSSEDQLYCLGRNRLDTWIGQSIGVCTPATVRLDYGSYSYNGRTCLDYTTGVTVYGIK